MELVDNAQSAAVASRGVPHYLTAEETMRVLRITSRTTLQKRIDAGLKVHRDGRRLLFDPADVAAYVDFRCTSPAPGQVA